MGTSGCFRLQVVDSLMLLRRCNSSILLTETISDECHGITAYERLSNSMGFSDSELSPGRPRKKKQKGWVCISWVFSTYGHGGRNAKKGEDAASEDSVKLGKKKKKRRPSWLPDPDRRWPLQGW